MTVSCFETDYSVTDRQMDIETNGQMSWRRTDGRRDGQTDGQAVTERQSNGHTDRQVDRQTDGQRDATVSREAIHGTPPTDSQPQNFNARGGRLTPAGPVCRCFVFFTFVLQQKMNDFVTNRLTEHCNE